MCMRWVMVVLSGMLLLAVCQPLQAQEPAAKRFTVRGHFVSRSQAIALSTVFPGLGQLATGHRYRGTALVAAEVGCLVVWLTAHEDYNTQSTQFDIEVERYFSLRDGGSFEAAKESWKRLSDKKDSLDRSHLLRQVFGVMAVAVYGYNLLDALVFDGSEPSEPSEPVAEKSFSIGPMGGRDVTGLALVARF